VGDLITAALQSEVRYRGKSLLPKGALFKGRIRRLEKYSASTSQFILGLKFSEHFIVALEFSEVEFHGHRARFFGQLKRIAPVPGLSTILSVSRSKAKIGRLTSETENLYIREVPGVATFFIEGTRFRLPEGLQMLWQTIKE
jgi:hypothetical protein